MNIFIYNIIHNIMYNIMYNIMQYVGNRAQIARGMEVRSVVGLRG